MNTAHVGCIITGSENIFFFNCIFEILTWSKIYFVKFAKPCGTLTTRVLADASLTIEYHVNEKFVKQKDKPASSEKNDSEQNNSKESKEIR